MRNFIVIFIFIFFVNNQSYSQELKKTYFGGGCFWCMEEAFDKVEGSPMLSLATQGEQNLIRLIKR